MTVGGLRQPELKAVIDINKNEFKEDRAKFKVTNMLGDDTDSDCRAIDYYVSRAQFPTRNHIYC